MQGVPEIVVRKIVRDNTIRLYNLDFETVTTDERKVETPA